MAIKKAQYNYYNSNNSYDTVHFETQVEQVLFIDNGVSKGNLKDKLSEIDNKINTINIDISNLQSDSNAIVNNKIGDTSKLSTTKKVLVDAINELKDSVTTNTTNITSNKNSILDLDTRFENHNHNSQYLSLNGGDLNGELSLPNNKNLYVRNTSGTKVDVLKMNSSNKITVGNKDYNTYIYSKNTTAYITNGTNEYKIFHNGNMGSGSTLDADKLDGLEGSSYAKIASSNSFTADQKIANGKSLVLQASSSNVNQAGSIFFRDYNGNQKARISIDTNGSIVFYAGGMTSSVGYFGSNGNFSTNYSHYLNGTDRDVQIRFYKPNGVDSGIGFGYSSSNGNFILYDWKNSKKIMDTDRASGTLSVNNGFKIGGHKVTINGSAPSNPANGDIWIDI